MVWTEYSGKFFMGHTPIETLPGGYYDIDSSFGGNLYLERKEEVENHDFLALGKRADVLKAIKTFRAKEKEFDKFHFSYKRGYLLFGPAGTGKSALLRQIIIDNMDAIVINVDRSPCEMEQAYKLIRSIEKNRTIIFVMEDLDKFDGYEEKMTELMDGQLPLHNVIFVATTNYLDMLSMRVIRPGRFDEIIEIGELSAKEREQYIKSLAPIRDMSGIKKLVKDTEGMSIAEIKNRVIEFAILQRVTEKRIKGKDTKKKTSSKKCRVGRVR